MLVAALVHKVADALVHGHARGSNSCGHGGHNGVIAGRNHQRTLAQDTYKLENVVVVRSEDRNGSTSELRGKLTASAGVQALHGNKNGENFVALEERRRGPRKRGKVARILRIDRRARFMKIDSAVLAVLVSAGSGEREVFRERSFHRPHERQNRTKSENWRFLVPAGVAQHFTGIFGSMRLESPGRVRAEFGGNTQPI